MVGSAAPRPPRICLRATLAARLGRGVRRLFNFGLMHSAGHVGAISSEDIRRLFWSATERPRTGNSTLRAALEQSLHLTFVSMFVIALFVAVAAAPSPVPKVTFAAREAPGEGGDRVRSPPSPAFRRRRRRASSPGRTWPIATGTNRSRSLDYFEPDIGEASERRERAVRDHDDRDAGASRALNEV